MNKLNTTQFDPSISDDINSTSFVNINMAQELFDFFKNCNLFRWSDANNDCEDRANAICILLDEWNIPNFKGWVFSGFFLKKDFGSLVNKWNYHVAPLLPVKENDVVTYYIIDPATKSSLTSIEDWAAAITDAPSSYYAIKSGDTYIFPSKKIDKDNWYKRNKRNYRWTMQGLSGINGVSVIGKAQLSFTKSRVLKAEKSFKQLMKEKPSF